MAPSATTDDNGPIPGLPEDAAKAPAGVVIPPKDIRRIVETTAGFVARNGIVFEDRIRERERTNPKFCFLGPNDAYAPFYAWRLHEIREGRGTAVSAGRVGEATPVPQPEKPKGPAAPPEFNFSARMPNISAQDLDVLRLTALFVAQHGRSFMTTLSQREARNFQFDFLRPQHSLYQFFSRLVDQYTLLLQSASAAGERAAKARMEDLEHNMKERFHILERAKKRSEWVRFQEEQKQKEEERVEKEQVEYAQIDWHDFVVVETVLFEDADDQAELPPPTSLNDLQSASLETKAAMSLQPHDRRIEEAFPTSEDHGLFYNQQIPQPPPSQAIPQPPAFNIHGQVPQVRPAGQMPTRSAQEDEEDRAIAERATAKEAAQAAQAAARGSIPAQPKIRSDYVPRAQAKRQNVQMALCPNCKQQIPFDELEHHMKIELLDPRWKEQRQKAEARQATTNLSTSDVAANLKRLASQRSDVFDGVTGQPVLTEDEAARRKKAALGNSGNGYDGQMDTSGAGPGGIVAGAKGGPKDQVDKAQIGQGINMEEQIRRIHEKAARG